jgi:hypothetical protein
MWCSIVKQTTAEKLLSSNGSFVASPCTGRNCRDN